MKRSARRFARASLAATEPTAPGGCGRTLQPKVCFSGLHRIKRLMRNSRTQCALIDVDCVHRQNPAVGARMPKAIRRSMSAAKRYGTGAIRRGAHTTTLRISVSFRSGTIVSAKYSEDFAQAPNILTPSHHQRIHLRIVAFIFDAALAESKLVLRIGEGSRYVRPIGRCGECEACGRSKFPGIPPP